MQSKNILFVTYENPFTKNTGDSIYSANIMEALFGITENIDFIYFDSNQIEPLVPDNNNIKIREIKVIPFKRKYSVHFIFSLKPGMVVNRYSNEYIYAIKQLLNNNSYDAIFINHLKMVFTLPTILQYSKNSKIIYISHNVEYLLNKNLANNNRNIFKKIIYWQDALKMYYFEKKHIPKFDVVTAICEHDSQYYKEQYKAKFTQVLRPLGPDLLINDSGLQKKKINQVIIAGSFNWQPKIDNLFLLLNSKNFKDLYANNIYLTIVGMASKELVNKVNKEFIGVNMTGPVDDMKPYYDNAKIAIIAEKLGGGFKLKIIEAAKFRTAIVAIEGAITKCDFQANEHYIESPTFEDLILEIINLQTNPDLAEHLIEKAFNIAKCNYNQEKNMATLAQII